MSDKKRVYCLYRVSTKGQVEKDDIPMQNTAGNLPPVKDGKSSRNSARKAYPGLKFRQKTGMLFGKFKRLLP
ncbi:hypothetical protein A7X67_04330 [Clostridium sp. W14A]|nr:hypothetical protein A7X67_04330 [Clostridium sp. W14A]